MTGSPATLLVVSHDRRLLETVCETLWVVDDGVAAPFDGGYRAWRAAVAAGWTVAGALEAEAKRLHIGSRNPGGPTARAIASAGGPGAAGGNGRSPRTEAAVPAARPRPRKAREALEGGLPPAAGRARRGADAPWSAQEPSRARDGRSRRGRELRRAAAGHQRARRRRHGAPGGRGRLAGARGAGAVTVRIGLTGPIGCGKTTVAAWLGELPDVVVIDADRVARQVVEPGEPALEDVFERFGEALRRPDGSLDRAALGRIVFTDPVGPARSRGDRPSCGPPADPRHDEAGRQGRRHWPSSSRRSSSWRAAWPRCATRSGWSPATRSTSSGGSATGACRPPRPTSGSPARATSPNGWPRVATRIIDTSDTAEATKALVYEEFEDAVALSNEGA